MNEPIAPSTASPHGESALPSGVSEKVAAEEVKQTSFDRLRQFLARSPWLLGCAWILSAALFISIVPVAYVAWWSLIGKLSSWAGAADGHWARWFLAGPGVMALAYSPLIVACGAIGTLVVAAGGSLAREEEAISYVQRRVEIPESDATKQLENTVAAGLLPLLTYSRAQLDAYYNIGLSQTKKSFFHGIVAMWLGFALLLTGLALYIVPLEQYGLKSPNQDFKIVILSGSAIIEFISALFLWMYKSTTAQLTYLYDRQMHSHTAILCFLMAARIDPAKGDETRAAIVAKLMDWHAKPVRPALLGGRGLAAFMPKQAPDKKGE